MRCPKCKKDLRESGIGYAEEGEMLYKLYLDNEGSLSWEQDEMVGNGTGYYFCRGCGEELSLMPDTEIVRILSGKDK